MFSQNSIRMFFASLLMASLAVVANAQPKNAGFKAYAGELKISKSVVVDAPPAEVWNAWTTNEGAQTFFAPKTNIKAELGGPYEVFFSPDAPRGTRGAEDLLVHDVQPGKSITFQWSAPPQFPETRKLRTLVKVTLEPVGANQTKVELNHFGFGHDRQWVQVHAYFTKAWDYVLGNLEKRFKSGPIDWANR
jgi:uncharacterized protein YndB with AHSA1/START domain